MAAQQRSDGCPVRRTRCVEVIFFNPIFLLFREEVAEPQKSGGCLQTAQDVWGIFILSFSLVRKWEDCTDHGSLVGGGITASARIYGRGVHNCGIVPGVQVELFLCWEGSANRTVWGSANLRVYVGNVMPQVVLGV